MSSHYIPDASSQSRQRNPWLAIFLSFLLPGSGQAYQGFYSRGFGILLTIVVLVGLILWRGTGVLFAPVLGIWVWNMWDAWQVSKGRQPRMAVPALLAIIVIYSMAFITTEVQPRRMITGWESMGPYVRALFHPELFEYPTEDLIGTAPIQAPCVEPLPEPSRKPTEHPKLTLDKACANVGDALTIRGEGFFPNFEGELWWISPIGDLQRVVIDGEPARFMTDDQGTFEITVKVPLAVPISEQPPPGETQTHQVRAEQHKPYGNLQPTQTLSLIWEKIGETIALAFLATVLGAILALPFSFLAARNLMFHNRFTRGVYYVVRTTLNIVRSIETLMWAIIFAVWVGLGPFGGMLALMIHTIAALGKLYSEAIESIDPGPIEAVRATGANDLQVIAYAVIPQILPSFASFTLYRWDINVRMSTVIGLISDAGIGFLVIQWIRLNQFSAMATAILAIMFAVTALDYASSMIRKRIIEGTPAKSARHPLVAWGLRGAAAALFVAAFAWSWHVAQVDFTELVQGAPAGVKMAKAFAVPDFLDRPTEEHSVRQPLPVPCGVAETPSPPPPSGPRVVLEPQCGDVGDPLTITGYDLPPNTDVSIRWELPDGAFLRVKSNCCTTDANGMVQLQAKISPLMEITEESPPGSVGYVSITWQEVVGGPRLSETTKTVANLALVTLLMALLATTFSSFFAIPLSFFAARNIMGESLPGRIIYNLFRMGFNLTRSIEPMILVLIMAAWVGAGPFAGVLALIFNNIPNLGKLFSETIEDIDTGPVEAIVATGANKLQTLVYAIVPQLVPPFLAFILYQWDINIRMSTVIGFVGGGGIGQQFRLWVGLNQYDKAGTAVWAIVIMVWSMDYLSAKAREKLV
ncbi:MAG TPA: phosphonate ABC transporter, permease protein PhnE [Anaerolineae bacterium]|nr:phosphonate ABC transporter, permease protein PhnE [Anaerolineae bacterium]HIQ12568.1 phosphonate ABC transporter, permease protein PhnE [Caldilineales bacterium]